MKGIEQANNVESMDGMWFDGNTGEVLGKTTKMVTDVKPKIMVLKSKDIKKLSEKDLSQIIYYDNGGRWISDYFSEGRNLMTRRLTVLCKEHKIGAKDELRIRRLFDLVSTSGNFKLEYGKNTICKDWNDLMNVEDLEIKNVRTLSTFKKILKELDIAREFTIEKPTRVDKYLIINPVYCMNNPIISDITFLCFSDLIVDRLSKWELEFYNRKYSNIFIS